MWIQLLRVAILVLAVGGSGVHAQSVSAKVKAWQEADLASAQNALSQAEKRYGPESKEVVTALESVAGSLFSLKRNTEAEQAYLRAMSIVEQAHGPGNITLMNQTGRLAEFYLRADMLAKAETTFNVVLKRYSELYGPAEQSVVASLNGLGIVYYKRHDFKTAKRYFDQVLSIVGKNSRPDAAQGLRAWQYVIQMYRNTGDEKNATATNDMALVAEERWKHAYEESPIQRCQTISSVFQSYAYFGHVAKAERAFDLLISTCNERSDFPPFYARELVLLTRSDLKAAQGDTQKAEAGYREILAYPEVKGGANLHKLAARVSLIALLRAKGDEDVSAELKRQVLAQEGAIERGQAKWLAGQRNSLGRIYLRRGRLDVAESLFKDAMGSTSDAQRLDDKPALENACDLAELYASGADVGRAEPLFRQVLGATAELFGPDDLYSARAASGLLAIYERRGRKDDAEKLRGQLKKMREHGI